MFLKLFLEQTLTLHLLFIQKMGVSNRWPCLAKYVLKSPTQFCSGSISSIHLCFDMFIRLENWCFIYFENFKELLDWIHYHCCREHSDRVKSKHVYFSISNFNEWSLSWVGPFRKWLVNHPILVGKTSISNCFFLDQRFSKKLAFWVTCEVVSCWDGFLERFGSFENEWRIIHGSLEYALSSI